MSDWSDDDTDNQKPILKPAPPAQKTSAVDDGWGNNEGFESKNNDNNNIDDDETETTVHLEVDPSKVGRIVGSKGATINQLQSDFNVKIEIIKEDNENGLRDVNVTGSSTDVAKAVDEIKLKTADYARKNQDSGYANASSNYDFDETIEIETGLVGRIVGKQGATINQLQTDFNVKIDINKEDNENGRRDIKVSGGSQEDVQKAIAEIKAKTAGGTTGGDGDKPREIYIPQEPTEDENVLFSNNIKEGVNFKNFENIPVKLTGEDADNFKAKAISDFAGADFKTIVLENVEKAGYNKPTPVQKYAIPVTMAGRDLMACAQTGSGKTAAFLLPIINNLLLGGVPADGGNIRALIVTPTRELAMQIFDEARKFANRSWIKVAIAYGGVQTSYQVNKIVQGTHILVATPGRLCDIVAKGLVSYSSLKFLVLDEADRMLDMGFKEKIEEISRNPSYDKEQVQTMMFSATFPEEIQILAAKFLKNHIFLTIGIVGKASSDVTQTIMEVPYNKKRETLYKHLKEALKKDSNKRILVFVETKKTTDFLASYLSEKKLSSTSIHGDRFQREREIALNEFKKGTRKILVATSVAARGLDIKDVTDVINYDLPSSIDDYVHRIGRTGRVGNLGAALSFYDPEKNHEIRDALVDILKSSEQEVPEFLGSGGGTAGGSNLYGGVDIRGKTAGQVQEADDDEWN